MNDSHARSHSAAKCPFQFDPHTPEYAGSWTEVTAKLRTEYPNAWSETYGGFWIASRHQDIMKIAQQPKDFSTERETDPISGDLKGGTTIPAFKGFRGLPNGIDPPGWNAMRELLNPFFSKEAADKRRNAAGEIGSALLDLVIESGEMDLVRDFTRQLPGMITMDILGLQRQEWKHYAAPIHDMAAIDRSDPAFVTKAQAFDEFRDRVDIEVQKRMADPAQDLFSLLAHGTFQGRPLTKVERQDIALNVLAGGVDTTTALTSGALLHLGMNAGDRERLIRQPELRSKAREEFARYLSPIHGMARTALGDVEFDGWSMQKGDRVFVGYASANRDERMFDAAGEVRIDRVRNPHVAFGAGTHRCLGANFARMMFDVMVDEVLDRIPDYEVHEGGVVKYKTIGSVNGISRIPVKFTASTKRAPRPDWLVS